MFWSKWWKEIEELWWYIKFSFFFQNCARQREPTKDPDWCSPRQFLPGTVSRRIGTLTRWTRTTMLITVIRQFHRRHHIMCTSKRLNHQMFETSFYNHITGSLMIYLSCAGFPCHHGTKLDNAMIRKNPLRVLAGFDIISMLLINCIACYWFEQISHEHLLMPSFFLHQLYCCKHDFFVLCIEFCTIFQSFV